MMEPGAMSDKTPNHAPDGGAKDKASETTFRSPGSNPVPLYLYWIHPVQAELIIKATKSRRKVTWKGLEKAFRMKRKECLSTKV